MSFSCPESEIHIDRLNRKGRGIGHLQENAAVAEVVGGIPGDFLRIALGNKRRSKVQGRIREVLTPSPFRILPACAHVPECGGCAFQAMEYRAQLKEKEALVHELFAPLVDTHTSLAPIIPCETPWRYRNKMEFSFSQNKAGEKFLGLMRAGTKGKVLNLMECYLVNPWFIEVVKGVRSWWEKSGLDAYRMNDTGSLRTLVMREGVRTGDKMVMLTVSGNPQYALKSSHIHGFIHYVKQALPESEHPRLSIFLRIQQIHRGFPTQFYEMHVHGPDHIIEKLNIDMGSQVRELQFKISPTSFFQPNTLQAEKLYSRAVQLLSVPYSRVFDLYAGTATLGLIMALRARSVTAIELNPHAVFDAQANQEINGISNMDMLCGDVGKTLAQLRSSPDFIPPDLILVDPPRSGLDPLAITHITQLMPQQILYVSCNPLTQSSNVKQLKEAGYLVAAVQPIDQFPHTVHVENIVVLNRR